MVSLFRNIVCGANMGCPLDLVRIVMWTSNSEYNPLRFNGLIMRLRTPNVTSLLFPSGKMIMQGAKDDRTGNLGCRKVAKILERLGHNVSVVESKNKFELIIVENYSLSDDYLGKIVRLCRT